MKWYDAVAPIYDRAIDRSHLPYRRAAIQALDLRPGLTVLDIGCGTGLNFGMIMDAIGPRGTLIGIDSSTKMLLRARRKADSQKWRNVRLLQLDVRKLTPKDIEARIGEITVDRIICTLGFSVFPDWQGVFKRSFELLGNGGRYCVMDVFNDKVTIRTKIIGILFNADNTRRVWEPVMEGCEQYSEKRFERKHGDTIVIASGIKP